MKVLSFTLDFSKIEDTIGSVIFFFHQVKFCLPPKCNDIRDKVRDDKIKSILFLTNQITYACSQIAWFAKLLAYLGSYIA